MAILCIVSLATVPVRREGAGTHIDLRAGLQFIMAHPNASPREESDRQWECPGVLAAADAGQPLLRVRIEELRKEE